jgi:hypothetical protein
MAIRSRVDAHVSEISDRLIDASMATAKDASQLLIMYFAYPQSDAGPRPSARPATNLMRGTKGALSSLSLSGRPNVTCRANG